MTKYAFVDYENLNNLDDLAITQYEKVFLFLGYKQNTIKISEIFTRVLNLKIIKIKSIGENNLDFHIAYYLGKLDQEVDKKIDFFVLSKDKGYQGICQHIETQAIPRKCSLISSNNIIDTNTIVKKEEKQGNIEIPAKDIENYTKQSKVLLQNRETRHLPRTVEKLRNFLSSHGGMKNKVNYIQILDYVIDNLIKDKIIEINNEKLSYTDPKFKPNLKSEVAKQYILTKKTHRAKTLSSLTNDIGSKFNIRHNQTEINNIISFLKAEKIISIPDGKNIKYLQ